MNINGRISLLTIPGLMYRSLIDPMLRTSHACAAGLIGSGEKVLDVASGSGALSFMMSKSASQITAIDIDGEMIEGAVRMAGKKGISNTSFEVMDATDMAKIKDGEFDTSVISMAIHQFSPETGRKVLGEMMRVSGRLIIIDYSFPVKQGIYKSLTWLIERIAGGEHYRNFMKYMNSGRIMVWLSVLKTAVLQYLVLMINKSFHY